MNGIRLKKFKMFKDISCFSRLLQAHQLLCGRGSVLILLAQCEKWFGCSRVDSSLFDNQVVPNPYVWGLRNCIVVVTTQALRTLTCRFICSFTTRKGSDMERWAGGSEFEFRSAIWSFVET